MMLFRCGHVALLAAATLGIGWPVAVRALDCGFAVPAYFESIDARVDPAKQAEDLEARAALANLSPIVFSGRLADVRSLGGSEAQAPIELLTFRDVKVLRGELPRTRRDGRAIVAYYGWCDGSCASSDQLWVPGALLTIGIRPTSDAVRTDRKTIYHGRVDGQFSPCGGNVSQLQLKLMTAPAEEIARLIRQYPRRNHP